MFYEAKTHGKSRFSMDNFIKALVMDNVEAEINKPYPVIDMSLGREKNGAFCFGFDQLILIMFSEKKQIIFKERARLRTAVSKPEGRGRSRAKR